MAATYTFDPYGGQTEFMAHIRDVRQKLEQQSREIASIRELAAGAVEARKSEVRGQALEAALRTYTATGGSTNVLEDARAYEAYLKGE